MTKYISVFLVMSVWVLMACQPKQKAVASTSMDIETNKKVTTKTNQVMDTATFGAGCFWCVEAVFQRLEGVDTVISGYTGGQTLNPTYKEICTGTTGHAEVAQVAYDPNIISFEELLEVFWATHDPTTLNRQGNDVGTQYRSAIFYHNEEQKEKSAFYLKKLTEEKVFDKPIVTEITPLGKFYVAENYHQNYYNDNKTQGYCTFVINPKISKLKKVFSEKLKEEYK